MLLCDYAQASEGKLNIIGAGWSIKGPNAPMGIAIKIEVPWNDTNKRHVWRLELRDADGEPVTIETPLGVQPVSIEAPFEVGRPPGLPEGTPLDYTAALNLPPMPLQEQMRYTWYFEINGASQDDWHLSFLTRPNPIMGASFGEPPPQS